MTLSRNIRAGNLRHQVTIQSRSLVENAANERVPTFTDLITIWASIEPLTGREFWQAKQANAEITGKIRTRHLTGIKPTMRLTFGNRIFEIVSLANPGERNEELLIFYKEALD